MDKFDFLLRARPFIVGVDNQVLRYWANLEKIDDAMTRSVFKLQTYDFKIVFVESRIQPADVISRWEEDDHSDGVYLQRFLQGRILNGYGKEVPLTSLFCSETKHELNKYFQRLKRQTQSVPAEMITTPKWQTENKHITPDLDASRLASPEKKESSSTKLSEQKSDVASSTSKK